MSCVIAGCGPAGAVLGLLLARAGVRVTVLEKHADFLRDFRGDTIHASTLTVLDELGLGDEFARLEQQRLTELRVRAGGNEFVFADFGRLRTRHREIAMMPQWTFLDFITRKAREYAGFRLEMETEATGLLHQDGRVRGVTTARGERRADLTVAADGRGSILRNGLPRRQYGAPMDVLWFRVPKRPGDPVSSIGEIEPGRIVIRIDRGDYWQTGYVVPKGARPELPDVDYSVLDVRIDRLRRWHRPGFLALGDAAHAMSPIGGVGINLAIQDAVAAANILAEPLKNRSLSERDLAKVQRRRMPPTVITQAGQRLLQRRIVESALDTGSTGPLRLLQKVPVVPAYLIGIGVRPEHVRTGAPSDTGR